jgi:hypothetical protein
MFDVSDRFIRVICLSLVKHIVTSIIHYERLLIENTTNQFEDRYIQH